MNTAVGLDKIFISSDNRATFICPKCSRSRTEDVARFFSAPGEVKVKIQCKCGNHFDVILDRRKSYRRKSEFPGIFTKERDGYSGNMTVVDLSKSGFRFRVSTRQKLLVGDRLVVEFHLDDPARSLIRKRVEIKRITGLNIGVRFLSEDPSDLSDKAIRFYLL
jgi:hypothetical protein